MSTGNDGMRNNPSHRLYPNQRSQESRAASGTTPANLRPPTPPYPAQSPAQRLAAARGAQSARRTSSQYPDGPPAPLPRRIGGGIGGTGRVVQRFSGTGLTPRSVMQRQENRARRMTLALAIVAVVLITASAFLLFNPTVQLPGFGFAFGQRIKTVNSNQPLLLEGSPPPTPTAQDSNTPTPTQTPQGSNRGNATPTALPTATSKPTATPIPTATPVPTVVPSGAVVHLTPATKPVSWNGALSACPSGCAVPDQRIAANKTYTSSKSGTFVQTYAQGTLVLKEISAQGRLGWSGSIPPTSSSGDPWPCNSSWSGTLGPLAQTTFTCKVNGSKRFAANSILGYSGVIEGDPTCNTRCSFVEFYNPNAFTNYGYYTVTQQDCNTVINGANQNATSNGPSWGNSWVSSWLSQNSGNTKVWGASMSYASQGCSPRVGYQHYPNFTITGSTVATATALVYKFADAQQASIQQLTATLPAHTSLSSSTPCQSPTLSNVSTGSNNFTIQCDASGTEIWDWTTDTALQDSLKNQILGKTKAEAEKICNSMPTEIVAGSCHIDFTGGNVAIVPSDPSKIQIAVP